MFLHLLIFVVSATVLITTGNTNNRCITPNNEEGKCVKFTECQAFLKVWKNRTSKNIVFYRASKCGWVEQDPLVCCGSVAEFINETEMERQEETTELFTSPNLRIQPLSTEETPELFTSPNFRNQPLSTEETSELFTSPSLSTELYTSPPVPTKNNFEVSSHPNAHLIPQRGNCGQQTSSPDRIYGGNETAIDEYPWIALLGYKYENVETFNCGGSLINERYVLTAAHCVAGKNLVKVRLGEYNISQNPDCIVYEDYNDCAPPYQEFRIEEKILFESYTPRNKNRWNDIALLRLDTNVTFNDFVKPICLPLNGERSAPKEVLAVAGWGLTELNVTSELKLQVKVPLWSEIGCKEVYSIGYNLNLTEEQFCAGGQPGKDSCTGDSGGPLMRTYPGDLDYYMEGIVSFGPKPCGQTATPGVYVRVSEYLEWILDNLKPF